MFDRTIGSGTGPLVLWLLAIFIAVVALATTAIIVFGIDDGVPFPDGNGPAPDKPFDVLWSVLTSAIDPAPQEEPGWMFRMVTLLVTLAGILLISTLVGVLASGIDSQLRRIRRGRSKVLESGYTLILGWSSKIRPIIRELALANANQNSATVVILAMKDKVEMEEELMHDLKDAKNMKVICRTGEPSDLDDLSIVNPAQARAVILLAEEGKDSDVNNVKITLAIKKIINGPLPFHIVAVMKNIGNIDAIRRIDQRVQVVQAEEVMARIIVQATRQPGLGSLYEELFSFNGNEIYFLPEHGASGQPFGQIVMDYDEASIIGIRPEDQSIELNPPQDYIIKKTDVLIAIALDDDEIIRSTQPIPPPLPAPLEKSSGEEPERVAIIGWHPCGRIIMEELGELLPEGSSAVILHDPTVGIDPSPDLAGELRFKYELREGDTTSRSALKSLDLKRFNHIIVLNHTSDLSKESADNHSLLALIHLRDICTTMSLNLNIVCEIVDIRNRNLVSEGTNDDFIASEELVSKIMVQLSENEGVEGIFKYLLTSEGCEFHVRPIKSYAAPDTLLPFASFVAAGLKQGEIAVGYRKGSHVVLNPKKSTDVSLGKHDALIVLAEE